MEKIGLLLAEKKGKILKIPQL